jgi:hypothetical protein
MTIEFFIIIAVLLTIVRGVQMVYRAFGRPNNSSRGPLADDEYGSNAEEGQTLWIGPVSGSPMMNRSVTSRANYLSKMNSGGHL